MADHSPTRHITVVDLWTDTNRGDEALQRSLVALLRARFPDARITGVFRFGVNELDDAEPEIRSTSATLDEVLGGIRRTHYSEANLDRHTGLAHQVVSLWSFIEAVLGIACFRLLGRRSRRLVGSARHRSLVAIRDADLVVWKGKNFRDHQGLAALTRALTLSSAGLFAGWLNPQVHCVNASFWPIRRGPGRRVYRAAFARCRSLTVREPSSVGNARDLLGDRLPVAECPDLSYELLGGAADLVAASAPGPAGPTWDLALTVTSWGDPADRGRYADAVVAGVEQLAGGGARRVVVVPQVTRAAEDNSALVDTIAARLRAVAGVEVEVLEGPLSIGELLGVYGRCRVLLGARMHSCMFARAVGTPFVALSYDTGPKWEVLAGFWPDELLLEYGAAPAAVAAACAEAWANGPAVVAASDAAWRAGIAGVASNLDGLGAEGRSRVAFVLPTLVGGGAERVVGAVARELAGGAVAGLEVEVVSLLDPAAASGSGDTGVQVVALGAPRVRSALGPLVSLLRDRRPDAVMSTLKHVSIGLGLLAWRLPAGTRHVVRVANTYSSELAALPPARARALRLLIRASHGGADAFICGSVGVRDDLVGAFGVPDARCAVIPNPVDVDGVRLAAAEEPGGDHTASTTAVRFVAVGRLEAQKDHATLLRALSEVREAHGLDASLVVVGDGSRRSALDALAVELGIADHVRFTGFVENPYPWMGRATAVVLSSRFEGSPNVLLEALALGVRCVSTDCPHGPAEILVDDRLGTLVPVGDPVALAAAMAAAARAVESPGEAAAVAHRVAHVRAHHDLRAVSRAYAEVLLDR